MLSDWQPPASDPTPSAPDPKHRRLRARLLEAQRQLRGSGRCVLVLLLGDDRPGINQLLDDLHEWLEPRGLEVHTLDEDACMAVSRPAQWRYWRLMPAVGHIAIFYRSWIQDLIEERMSGGISAKHFSQGLRECQRMEQLLTQDRTVLVKCYLHLSDRKQQKRFRKARRDPQRHYRIHTPDRLRFEAYRGGRHIVDEALTATDTPTAPWNILDSGDRQDLRRRFGALIHQAMREAVTHRDPERLELPALPKRSKLADLDLASRMSAGEYQHRLREAQHELNRLSFEADRRDLSTVVVFEGVDAAGKGGAIRRLTRAISAEHYEIVPIAAPTPDELAHHYLWRFWAKLPDLGRMRIFDRSWYGRVLVERVEGLCSTYDWQRAYEEINDFEQRLVQHGYVLLKFWLHIDQEEQARRFAGRKTDPLKAFKITAEDLRNRAKWPAYQAAIDEMLHRTDTAHAPWTLVPANSKHEARVRVTEALRTAWTKRLG